MMDRRHNIQNVAWLYDHYDRGRLDMDPPYQRKSVWNRVFKDYFIDTVLLNYPAPAIFLYEEMSGDGRSMYHVVDGKQRLTTVFEFLRNEFAVSDRAAMEAHRGRYFKDLPEEVRRAVWSYPFLIEYLPSSDAALIGDVFDRINRNVAKLTPQELRHAKMDGVFISKAEQLADEMVEYLEPNFPRFADQSRKQMKDVEFIASLFLLLESGAHTYSQIDLDRAFLERDEVWDSEIAVVSELRSIFDFIRRVVKKTANGQQLISSRLRNQVDFYSFVGAVSDCMRSNSLRVPDGSLADDLIEFVRSVEDEATRKTSASLSEYYEAARSASSDKKSREKRIEVLRTLLTV